MFRKVYVSLLLIFFDMRWFLLFVNFFIWAYMLFVNLLLKRNCYHKKMGRHTLKWIHAPLLIVCSFFYIFHREKYYLSNNRIFWLYFDWRFPDYLSYSNFVCRPQKVVLLPLFCWMKYAETEFTLHFSEWKKFGFFSFLVIK